ncbi:uncharacterized protein LOC114961641 isoform X2 [Acropora millepora]|uniref:uncharacterized protein LOC114961641 isoform X2 n=1 Tax=Acropora millepora TaxID=45264 RepID=UPI001CF4A791|nr:uncharacterized protein LOC114961641 isoform X2 [Acropora millepora]
MLQDTSAQVIEASSPHKEPLYITLLASEWNSLAGGLSTLNREFAIHLAQQTNVRVSLLVPEGACNDRDKREAQSFDINVVEAKQRLGYEPLDWLGIPPEGHRMDVVVGHGVKLGRQVQFIKCFPKFQNCKWVHTVHTAPEDLGKYKSYENPTSRGEQKHWAEVGLCKCADLVVPVGPKLVKAYSSYLQGCKKQEDIIGLTPGLFDREFGDIVQIPKTENDDFKVLLCGRGDNEDFELKGYDIAVKAFADPRLKRKSYHLLFVGAPDGMQDEVRKRLLNHGITEKQLTVRKFVQCRSGIKELLCEVDLAIMPSKSEGFGLVALEALSAGLPVLVGSNSGFASAIMDLLLGEYSIVDSDDPAKWAEAIEGVCGRHGMRLDGIKILRERYGMKYVWKTQCKALVERLSGMISDDQGTSISQSLAADDSMRQQTFVIPEGTTRGTQGKQPATKTTRPHSVFTSKQSEFAMRSETCVEPTLSEIFYAETSTAQDQAFEAVNLIEQGPSSVSESVSCPDVRTIQHIVGDAVSSGRENGTQGKQHTTTTRVGEQDSPLTSKHLETTLLSDAFVEPSQASSERRSVLKQGRRPIHLHPSATPPVKKQRRDTDIRRVFTHNSVVVKLLREEYNRRAQLRPLFWDSTIRLPLEKVYTRLKIVSRHRRGNQGETKCWGDVIWAEDSRRDEIWTEARDNKVNPSDVFGMLKENKNVMTIIEGSPGIGKTTFSLKLAYDWANQSGCRASFPEFELVLLLKCRDIDGDLTKAITEQLFPKDLSKDAMKELFRFLEDIENQEKVLIILDGLDELPEKSRHYVNDLLHRKRWAFCYVLTTTRQEKGIQIREQLEFVFDLFLQIEGFTEEDSFEYIRRHFKIAGPEHLSKGENLIEEIKQNALLQDLRTNPLNLLLLCVVYEDHEGELPSSRTDLYHVIVVCLLRRYCAKHNMKASKWDMDLETQFERDIRCLGKLAWNCLLNDRHSFFEEELEELESRNEKLVARELGFVYKEESLKRLKPQHEYCFLHKSFQEYLAASYVARKLRRKKFNVFKHLNFDAVVKKFPQVFVFVCGILREEASILFAQIGEELKSDWEWLKDSLAAAEFFIDSWSESGNAEGMANTLCSFIPFPRVVHLFFMDTIDSVVRDEKLMRVLLFCRTFSEVKAPDEIHFKSAHSWSFFDNISFVRDLAFLPNLKSLDIFGLDMNVEMARELFQGLPDFASLTKLVLPAIPETIDWDIVAEALTASKVLERVAFTLIGERGDGWARALYAGLCADTPLSSVDLTISGQMSETALQALENLLLNKSLSSVSVIVERGLSYSLAVIQSRALARETAVKSLELRVNGKLSFCCANLIERGIVKNNSLSNLVVSLRGELPDNWQAILENLNAQLAEKSSVTFEICPNTFSPVTAIELRDVLPCGVDDGPLFPEDSITLNVWGVLTVDGAEALWDFLVNESHVTLNIHGKLTDDFLQCLARPVDEELPLCSITINTWDQLTNEGRAIFKELELDKNPAVTLNVCDKHVPSDESGDNEIESIDDPESLIALFEEAENTGKENLTVTINVQSDDSTCDDSDDSSCDDSDDSIDILHLVWARNWSLNSLSLTINNFRPWSTRLSLTLIDCLEGCISLKSLNLTLNEYHGWEDNNAFRLREGLGRNTSLISLTLTLNIHRIIWRETDDLDHISKHFYGPITSVDSFTLTVSDFTGSDGLGLYVVPLLSDFKSLTTLNVTLNRCGDFVYEGLPDSLVEAMKTNSLRTLRLKFNDSSYEDFYNYGESFSEWLVNSPSLKVIELSFSRHGVVGSSLQTLKWEKQ